MKKLADTHDQSEIAWQVERADRRELVWPAPKGFKPEVQGKKIRLRLIPRTFILRKGESFWYRIEIQNIGSETAIIHSAPFLKDGGRQHDDEFKFRITSPDGKAEDILIGTKWYWISHGMGEMKQVHMTAADYRALEDKKLDFFEDEQCHMASTDAYSVSTLNPPVADWSGLSEAQRKIALRDWYAQQGQHYGLRVDLLPGETLGSRAWQYRPCADEEEAVRRKKGLGPLPSIKGLFRQLKTPYPFETPGIYTLTVIYADPKPKAPAEKDIQALEERGYSRARQLKSWRNSAQEFLGIVESNEVKIERLP